MKRDLKYYNIKKTRKIEAIKAAKEAEEAEEALREEVGNMKYMEIKNLSQLKKALKEGHLFEIINHVRPESVGQIRFVKKMQTNGIYSGIYKDPEHEISKANNGKGAWLDFGKASDWKFENNICSMVKYYNVSNTQCTLSIMVLEEIAEQEEQKEEPKKEEQKKEQKPCMLSKKLAKYAEDVSHHIVKGISGFFKGNNCYYTQDGHRLVQLATLPDGYTPNKDPKNFGEALQKIIDNSFYNADFDYTAIDLPDAKEIREGIKNLVGRKLTTVGCRFEGMPNGINARWLAGAMEALKAKKLWVATKNSATYSADYQPFFLFENDDFDSVNMICILPLNGESNDYWIVE